MGKRKDLSEFDKGQIVMARRLGQSISKTAALVGCSRSAVVRIYQKWSKEGTVVNRRQGHGRPRLIDARGERSPCGKTGKRKDLSEFVMARRLGQSVSKTAALVGCSRSAVVSIYQKCSKEGTVVNRRQGHGQPRLTYARGE
ncbi:hypothetical protein DPX16_17029 [Anabarilius grahami]|uniref:Transposase Tc1-like domain-containing protein n=1 Tax=Anabarilius grahami TaxID=495550 RepID=A0A3N0YBR7_ANAGA|nr:hypothetical protein DPX16_17029 [Anabarilius grahami]